MTAWSGPTPAARSPTSWPTTAGSSRCCPPPTTPAGRCGTALRRAAPAPDPRRCSWPTARRWPPTPCWSGGAPGRAGHHGRLRRRDRDRPPGPAVALRHLRRPARAAGRPGRAGSRSAAASTPTAPSSSRSTRRSVPADPRRTSRRWPSACCTPTSTPPTRRRWPRRCAGVGYDVTCSYEVSPEFREYERTVTTVVNAYLRPACRAYLGGLAGAGRRGAGHDVGRRAGAGRRSRRAARRPAAVGPGRRGAGRRPRWPPPAASPTPSPSTWAARRTDVCLVRGGVPEPAADRVVGGLPVRLPALDIHTIGAGGGSIARLDAGWRPGGRPRERRRRARPGLLRPRRHRADGDRRRPGAGPHPRRARPSRASAGSIVAAAGRPWPAPGVDRRRGGRRGRRGHGAGGAGRDRRAGRRPPRPGPGRLRRRRPAARLRPGRRAGHAGRDRPAPGRRALGRRAALLARASASWCGRGRRPPTTTASPAALAELGAAGGRAVVAGSGEVAVETPSTAATPARATSSPCPTVAAFAAEHERRNGYARPGRAGRGGRPAGPGPPAGAAVARRPARLRPGPSSRAGRGRRARLHRLGARRLGGRARTQPAPGSSTRTRR